MTDLFRNDAHERESAKNFLTGKDGALLPICEMVGMDAALIKSAANKICDEIELRKENKSELDAMAQTVSRTLQKYINKGVYDRTTKHRKYRTESLDEPNLNEIQAQNDDSTQCGGCSEVPQTDYVQELGAQGEQPDGLLWVA